jgi:hypothetical protein
MFVFPNRNQNGRLGRSGVCDQEARMLQSDHGERHEINSIKNLFMFPRSGDLNLPSAHTPHLVHHWDWENNWENVRFAITRVEQ